MHAVVLTGNGFDGKVAESADLQLEGQRWFKMAVDCVLSKLRETGERGGGRGEGRGGRGEGEGGDKGW